MDYDFTADKSVFQSAEALVTYLTNLGPDKIRTEGRINIKLPNDCYYERLALDFETNGGSSQDEVGFSWSLERNFKVSGNVGYVFPVRGDYVITFKTFKGMVRNLVKYLDFVITRYAENFKPVMKEAITSVEVRALVVRDKRNNSIIQLTPISDAYSHVQVEYPSGYVTPQELREYIESWMGKGHFRALEAEAQLLANRSWFDEQEAKDFMSVGNLLISIETREINWT